jgi:hypothetical protein
LIRAGVGPKYEGGMTFGARSKLKKIGGFLTKEKQFNRGVEFLCAI